MPLSEIDAATFFRAWFGDLAGWLVIWCKKQKVKGSKREAFSGKDYAEKAARYAMEMDAQGFDAYFGLCPLGFRPAPGDRGEAQDTCSMPGVWVEIDVSGPGHVATTYAPDLPAALALVAQFPHQPTALVHSGGGVHCYWKFPIPLELKDAVGREQARALTDRFQAFFKSSEVNPNSYKIDTTADLARVLRVPGTHNFKELHK